MTSSFLLSCKWNMVCIRLSRSILYWSVSFTSYVSIPSVFLSSSGVQCWSIRLYVLLLFSLEFVSFLLYYLYLLSQIKYLPHWMCLLGNDSTRQCTLNQQLLLVDFYFVLPQFQIKGARFSWEFPTCVHFCTKNVVLFLEPFQKPTF